MTTTTESPVQHVTRKDGVAIPALPNNPDKAAEIAHYRAIVDSLPRTCYLRDILRDTVEPVASLIRDDLAYPDPLYRVWAEQAQAHKEIVETRKALLEAKRELSALQMQCSSRRGELRDLASSAEQIARTIRKRIPA